MHNTQRMERQLALFDALRSIVEENERHDISPEVTAMLVIAARIDEFCEDFGENIHRAGEGI